MSNRNNLQEALERARDTEEWLNRLPEEKSVLAEESVREGLALSSVADVLPLEMALAGAFLSGMQRGYLLKEIHDEEFTKFHDDVEKELNDRLEGVDSDE